ncbi:MAG: hypothetical protein CMD16_00060 [Flavobacteriales bacterium]|nr:hypothetical protein [Flavobacteriales bacterium]
MDEFLIIFIILIIYVIVLFLFKKWGIGKKQVHANCTNACPDCFHALNRIRRTLTDRLLHHTTFSIFDARRYVCNECGWEGLRWEDKFRPGLD